MSDLLDERLRSLAAAIRLPDPDPALADRVLARVSAPSPRPSRARRRWAVVAALVVVLLGLAVSPVGARIVEWLDFGGVMVRDAPSTPVGSSDPATPTVPAESPGVPAGASFTPLVPSALGPPDGVGVSRDGGRVSMTWTVDGETIRLDQFDATLEPYFWKSGASEIVTVAGRDGLWFAEPHEVVVVPEGGDPTTHPPRLAGRTLVVPWDRVTLRLEGDVDLPRAVEIVSSVD